MRIPVKNMLARRIVNSFSAATSFRHLIAWLRREGVPPLPEPCWTALQEQQRFITAPPTCVSFHPARPAAVFAGSRPDNAGQHWHVDFPDRHGFLYVLADSA